MLGEAQERWLADGLSATDATWPVIAQQTVVLPLMLGDVVLNPDQWDGYTAARSRLYDTIIDADLPNTVVLSGDIHSAGAATHVAERGGTEVTVAHEFVCTSISSVSVIAAHGDAAVQVVEQVAADAAYFEAELHGYCRVSVTPDRWETQFVVVDSVDSDDAPARVDATVTLEAGAEELVRT